MLIQDGLVLFGTFKRLLFPNSVSWFRLFYHFLQQAGSKESSVTEYLNTQISQCVSSVHTPTVVQCALDGQFSGAVQWWVLCWAWLSFIPFCETEPSTQQHQLLIECCLPLCSLDHHELKYQTKQWPQDATSWPGHLEI